MVSIGLQRHTETGMKVSVSLQRRTETRMKVSVGLQRPPETKNTEEDIKIQVSYVTSHSFFFFLQLSNPAYR